MQGTYAPEKIDVLAAEEVKPFDPDGYIKQVFADAPIMYYVALAESGSNGKACVNNVNSSSSARGCFQILYGTFNDPVYGCTGDRMNHKDNIDCARKIYNKSGTVPWNPSKHVWGKYLK